MVEADHGLCLSEMVNDKRDELSSNCIKVTQTDAVICFCS